MLSEIVNRMNRDGAYLHHFKSGYAKHVGEDKSQNRFSRFTHNEENYRYYNLLAKAKAEAAQQKEQQKKQQSTVQHWWEL